jgi:Peptidase inhibitor I78 family
MKTTSLIAFAGLALMACSPSDKPAVKAMSTPASAPPAVSTSAPAPETPVPPTSTSVTTEDTCGKAQYANLVGKLATDPGVPAASPTVRRITPGMQVTMDFAPARLDIRIGPDGKIAGLTCG